MILNLVFLGFCGLLAWLLFRFPFQNAKSPEEYRKLFLFFCVLAGFLIFNGFLAYIGMGGLKLAAKSPPITDLLVLEKVENQEGLILSGVVSDRNQMIFGDYVAYTDEEHLWSPKGLLIDLKQGQVAISNNTYRATDWPVDILGYSYLKTGQPVIVVGYLENSTNLLTGEKTKSIRADLVYSGTHAAFASRARIQQIFAIGLLLANIVLAAMIVLIPVRECSKEMKKGGVKSS